MMWQVACAINTTKSFLPFQGQLRRFKRTLYPPSIGAQHKNVISGGIDHVEALRGAGLHLRGAHILEIGTGWFPIMPLMLRIAGVERVYLTDLHLLMDIRTLRAAADYVAQNAGSIAGPLGVSVERVYEITAVAQEQEAFDRLLERLGFTYLVPFNPGAQPLQVDAVISQTVFEHIPPDILRQLLVEVRASLKPRGFMSHGIDNTDHRVIKDKRLGRFDFLRYGDRTWKLLCRDPQDYTNRLRHKDYLKMLEATGYVATTHKTFVFKKEMEAVSRMPLAPRFRDMPTEDLVIGWSHLVAQVASPQPTGSNPPSGKA